MYRPHEPGAAPAAGEAEPPARPMLKAGLRRLWRDERTLQLGIGPAAAVVVQDVDRAVSTFLERLDGTTAYPHLADLAGEVGADPVDALDLVRRLGAHGVLEDAAADRSSVRALTGPERDRIAPDLAAWSLDTRREVGAQGSGGPSVHARRRRARVVVYGAGRVGALAAALLTHAGIGDLDIVDPEPLRAADVPAPWARSAPVDAVGRPSRADVALDVCEQMAPSLRTARRAPHGARERPARTPTVALLAPVDSHGTVDLELRDALVRGAVPHLPAYVRETVGIVGPFVIPGVTPCLRCVDLTRTDRDPAWPRLLAQLTPPPASIRPRTRRRPADPCDGVLATAVAAQAAIQVLLHIDGHASAAAATTLETDPIDGMTRWRSWQPHPACGCMWSDAEASGDG